MVIDQAAALTGGWFGIAKEREHPRRLNLPLLNQGGCRPWRKYEA
ncbi:MAG: hypothetical protein Q8891_00055 [Bacteroidota bacterium]|nr:hypothetical protein [Bacteroidota bacterium]